ncbi:MAG: presqualene diphosphate synthase HpnD [Ignavibacterium sp.]|nr:presqualene diphosphate synthase HpnD [Ignavibacterium sp.]MDW8374082.1 presqualene diphosphate synthase HpnD [Ignavibacteriales bacterium]
MTSSAQKISKKSNSSFYYAFNMLPKVKREAMNILYAFCRKTDDIVDNDLPVEIKIKNLNNWLNEFEKSLIGNSKEFLLNELSKVISFFKIPLEPFYDLIKGMEMDIKLNRYENFEILKQYCYRVASTVGLISIEIFGYSNKMTKDFAVNLGIALQLTNILRDVNSDLSSGRIYIPKDEMKLFNYSEDDLLNKKYSESFVNLMKFQVERAENYFKKAKESLPKEDEKNMFPAKAMQLVYLRILEKIKKYNYDVFSNNIRISNLEKLFIALRIWFGNKFL